MKDCLLSSIKRGNPEGIIRLVRENTEAFIRRLKGLDSAIIVGYSTHRPEIIPAIKQVLSECDVICLEEPQDIDFHGMLGGDISLEEYISERDFSFPYFQKEFYSLLKNLWACKKEIVQVDPYLSRLMKIHEIFAQGGTHRDLPADHQEVYSTERTVSAHLVRYYSLIPKGSFDRLVHAVMDFAKSDAGRIKLRDRMRAEAIRELLTKASRKQKGIRVYIEAGYIHQPLYGFLLRQLEAFRVIPYYPASPVVKFYMSRKHIFSPGDILTLRYAFKAAGQNYYAKNNVILAARSLVYTKIITKDEVAPSDDLPYPHTLDEIGCYRVVKNLSFNECSRIFNRIRYMTTEEARCEIFNYISPAYFKPDS